MTLSKSTRFYFEQLIDFSWANQGSLLAGKFRQVYCFYCLERRWLVNLYRISMQEIHISMQERILPRQFEY